MQRGFITEINKKGQVVIPKRIREALGIQNKTLLNITKREKGIYIHPVSDIVLESKTEKSYLKILEKTKGTWSGKDWDKTRKKRRRVELGASKDRKKSW